MTQWAKSGDTRAKNKRKLTKNLSDGLKKQVSASLPSLPKWVYAAPGYADAAKKLLNYFQPIITLTNKRDASWPHSWPTNKLIFKLYASH